MNRKPTPAYKRRREVRETAKKVAAVLAANVGFLSLSEKQAIDDKSKARARPIAPIAEELLRSAGFRDEAEPAQGWLARIRRALAARWQSLRSSWS